MNAECLMQWNRLKKEVSGDFPLEKLECKLQTYLDENPDDGERTARATLRSIREALGCREHEDEVVRHKAGKLLKSCRHSFDEVRKNANHFRKELAEARERRAEIKAAPGTIPLGGGFRLEEVLSLKRLMAIGKALANCFGKRENAERYWEQAEAGEFKFWLLLKEEEPFALLKIDVNENEEVVGQLTAHDNDDPEISFELAMKILHELGVTADGEAAFARAGAYGRFKGGRPEVEPVRVGEQEMWIWPYEDELIVGMEEHADGRLYWSRFVLKRNEYNPYANPRVGPRGIFTRGEWDDDFGNHLSMGMLFEIVRRNPHVLEKLRSPIAGESRRLEIAA
ncbi:MAG: hypothetical protein OXG62_03180 [Nitrospinae bacterium]|nr:hypothetical protein [Nitrospinota bacterium]